MHRLQRTSCQVTEEEDEATEGDGYRSEWSAQVGRESWCSWFGLGVPGSGPVQGEESQEDNWLVGLTTCPAEDMGLRSGPLSCSRGVLTGGGHSPQGGCFLPTVLYAQPRAEKAALSKHWVPVTGVRSTRSHLPGWKVTVHQGSIEMTLYPLLGTRVPAKGWTAASVLARALTSPSGAHSTHWLP